MELQSLLKLVNTTLTTDAFNLYLIINICYLICNCLLLEKVDAMTDNHTSSSEEEELSDKSPESKDTVEEPSVMPMDKKKGNLIKHTTIPSD